MRKVLSHPFSWLFLLAAVIAFGVWQGRLSFTHPHWLLVFPFALYYFYCLNRTGRGLIPFLSSYVDLSPGRRNFVFGVRMMLLLLVFLALAGLQWVRINHDLAVMFVLDHSDSISPQAKEAQVKFVNEAVTHMRGGDKAGIIVFGAEAFVELSPAARIKVTKIQSVPPTQYTDIAAAIRLAMASFPEGMQKRIVLLSDGNENLGNALDEAQMARTQNVPIDVIPLVPPPRPEIVLDKIVAPSEAKIGEPIELRLVIRSTVDATAKLKLFRNDAYLGERTLVLSKDKTNNFTFPQTVEKQGFTTFEAILETTKGRDTLFENNRGLAFVNIQGKPKVLLVEGDPRTESQWLERALRAEKVDVERRDVSGIPTRLTDFQNFDSIVLSNVPAWDLSLTQMQAIQAAVRDLGIGLVMIGGEHSFGPGGYRDTPIEKALPVKMDVKNQQVMPSGAVAMVMHSCEFPNGNDWAKATCTEVINQLGPEDFAGVIEFGMTGAGWVFPMLKVGPNKRKMQRLIRGMNPGDMPDFGAVADLAYEGLRKTKARLKHMIILSDGDPALPTPQQIAKIRRAGITITTLAVGPHNKSCSDNMKWLAFQGKGRFYEITKFQDIPKIFLKEAATVMKSAIVEEPFRPRVTAHPLLKGIRGTPPLLGYVGTSEKPRAEVIFKSHRNDPVLAVWQYGLGRSLAFTSDAKHRWAAPWIPWSGYPKFWAQAVRWTMRQTTPTNFQTTVDITRGKGRIIVDAVDEKGNFINFLNAKARIIPPFRTMERSASSWDVPLEQTAPGRYEATFDAREVGTYTINIHSQGGGQKPSQQVTGAVIPYSPEYKDMKADRFLLARLADVSGGRQYENLQRPEDIFAARREGAKFPREMWLPLLTLAACLLPFDIAVRRLMVGKAELVAILLFLWQHLPLLRRRQRTREERDEHIGRLLDVKQRVRQREEGEEATTTTPREPPRAPTPARQPTPPPSQPSAQQPSPPPSEQTSAAEDTLSRLRKARDRARGQDKK
ncbi:MAG: glutamine amidotransferase [Abditibacteriales bacterium]|nr:glutamine amidotransferase [Abditibacteriales bacterium]MDW8365231.1 glutamine amidotransferase [Abditibacteriales bacterium]